MINKQRGGCFQISAYKIVAVSLCRVEFHIDVSLKAYFLDIEEMRISNLRLANIKKPLFCNFFTTTTTGRLQFLSQCHEMAV